MLRKIVFILCLSGFSTAFLADSIAGQESKPADLDSVRSRIDSVETKLKSAKTELDALNQELKNTEKELSNATRQLKTTNQRITAHQETLKQLQLNENDYQVRLKAQRQLLARQIRAAYISGNSDYLKLLLNQEDPYLISRSLVYYDYFNRTRSEQMATLIEELTAIASLEAQIKEETGQLQEMRIVQQSELEKIQAIRESRQSIVNKLQASIKRQGIALELLREDEKRLTRLTKSLESRPVTKPRSGDSFASRKGKMNWPVEGRITKRFGSLRNTGQMKWQGVVMKAPAGAPVMAISDGKVVYADWFRNIGLLIIIEHDAGYMSLYGYNQTIYPKPGDTVQAGDVIAEVGDSGGNTQSALYFEIRHQGLPKNPSKWCRRPQKASR